MPNAMRESLLGLEKVEKEWLNIYGETRLWKVLRI